jgi:Co/Zn/Cd efflux system component
VHDHTFGQDEKRYAERRTLIVSVVTLVTMTVEIAAGIAFGSMALLADGLHMLPGKLGLVHVTVETHLCAAHVREAL